MGQTGKFAVQVMASPDYYRGRYGELHPDIPGFAYSARVGFSAGVQAWYQVKKKVSLGSGLLYSRKDYQLTYDYRVIDRGDPNVPVRSILRPAYLELPLAVRYALATSSTWALHASTGITGSFLVHSAAKTTYDDGHSAVGKPEGEPVNGVLLSLPVGLGVTYYVSPRLGLVLEPQCRYYVTKIDANAFQTNPVQLSLRAGTMVHF
ncbi:MAG: PorT family protein [Cytophagales bacterium]|nr:PorT family protein [Cytophagales bacterium]